VALKIKARGLELPMVIKLERHRQSEVVRMRNGMRAGMNASQKVGEKEGGY
jgi:hypothetical protein